MSVLVKQKYGNPRADGLAGERVEEIDHHRLARALAPGERIGVARQHGQRLEARVLVRPLAELHVDDGDVAERVERGNRVRVPARRVGARRPGVGPEQHPRRRASGHRVSRPTGHAMPVPPSPQ